MSTSKLVTFRLTTDGGEGSHVVVVGPLELVRAERRYGGPVMSKAAEGFFEPIMTLAFEGALRGQLIEKTCTFDEFLDRFEVQLLDEDEAAAEKSAEAAFESGDDPKAEAV